MDEENKVQRGEYVHECQISMSRKAELDFESSSASLKIHNLGPVLWFSLYIPPSVLRMGLILTFSIWFTKELSRTSQYLTIPKMECLAKHVLLLISFYMFESKDSKRLFSCTWKIGSRRPGSWTTSWCQTLSVPHLVTMLLIMGKGYLETGVLEVLGSLPVTLHVLLKEYGHIDYI